MEDPADQALRQEVETLIAAAKDHPAKVLGVDENADLTQIKKAYRERVLRYHPDRHSAVTDPDLRDKLSHLLVLAAEAFAVFSERKEGAEARRGAQPIRVASAHPVSPPASKTAVVDEEDAFDKEKYARELFRQAETAYQLQDHWQTIQLSRRAIELCDKEAGFHHLLGLALLQNKKWRKDAAESLKTAAELERKNPLDLGTLAALYQAEGLQLRADKVLAEVMKIDPSYELPELPA